MKQYRLLLIIPVFLLASCEKEIEFKGDKQEPLLVLNGLLTPDEHWISIHLSESRFFLSNENEFKFVRNADVTLWKNEEAIAVFYETGDNEYVAPYRPIPGDRLRITASAPGLNPVECSTDILPAPEILLVEIADHIAEYPNDDFDYDVFVTLNDPVEVANYYRLNLYLRIYFNEGDYTDLSLQFRSDDVAFSSSESIPMGTFGNRYRVFTDDVFNGNEYTLKLQVRIHYEEEENDTDAYNYDYDYGVPTHIELHVDLQHITKEYYLYLKSRAAAWRDNDLGGMFTEPIQIYNNIQGGIGILGSYTSAVYTLPM